jgi:hypothetical protein
VVGYSLDEPRQDFPGVRLQIYPIIAFRHSRLRSTPSEHLI